MEKILVVDDEQGLRDVLSIMLKRAGYAVTAASDGDEAIAQVQKEIFDLVITDLKMPRVGGLEVLKAVKAASGSASTRSRRLTTPTSRSSPSTTYR